MKSFKQKQKERQQRLEEERIRAEKESWKQNYNNLFGSKVEEEAERLHNLNLQQLESAKLLAEEEKIRVSDEYEIWKEEQRLLREQEEQVPTEPVDTGVGIGHESTWQLTWEPFSKHPKIVNLPMSEKVRLFKIAQQQQVDRLSYYANVFSDNQHSNIGSNLEEVIYALSFSGDRSGATDSYATTTFNPDTYSLWNGFTISFWVRPDEEMNQKSVILGTRASSPVARFHFGFSGVGTNIGVGVGGNDITGINNPMEIGRWYNWVISYTGTQFDAGERKLRMWINTDARMTNNNSTSWGNQDEATESYTHGIYFGGRNTEGTGYSSGFACALDEVAIYNTCIDSDGTFANEVYNGGINYNHLTNGQSGLVGYWKFNEGSGTTITDHSGNGNHGTFGAIAGDTTAHPIWIKRE